MSSCGLQVVASSEYAFLLALPQPHTPSPSLPLLEIPPPNEADLLVPFPGLCFLRILRWTVLHADVSILKETS